MTEQDKRELAEMIKISVGEALASAPCQCGLTPDSAREMSHLCGMYCDLGNGNMAKGVEVVRQNHKSWVRWQSRCDQIGGWVVRSIVLAIVAAVVWLVAAGADTWRAGK